MSNVGKWLDRGINKLMGAPDAPPASQTSHPQPSSQGTATMSHPMAHAAGRASGMDPRASAQAASKAPATPQPGRSGQTPASGSASGPLETILSGQEGMIEAPGYRRSASETSFAKVRSHVATGEKLSSMHVYLIYAGTSHSKIKHIPNRGCEWNGCAAGTVLRS